MSPVFLAWLVEVGIVSVRDLSQSRRLPFPSELLATFVVFGGLSIVAESETFRPAANATAWGIVIATFLSSQVDFLKPVADFFAPGVNAQAADLLAGYSGPAPTVGSGANDTGNILSPYLKQTGPGAIGAKKGL